MRMHFTRRQAITAGIASLGATALDGQQQPMKIGVIGLGNRGNQAHVRTLKQLSEAKITAICDVQLDRMQKVNEGLPSKAATYVDYRELIKDPNVGIVVVATPGYLHHEMAVAALRAGKDLVLEAEKSGRVVAVGMQRRYSDGDALFQSVLDSGLIGPVKMIVYSEYRGD